MSDLLLLSLLIFAAALLYSSVGHGGGSGYLAAMALVGVAPEVMKPAALSLNILVAGIGTVRFYRAGAFSWRLFVPFALGSVPAALIGGILTLPGDAYKRVVGLVLIIAACRLFIASKGLDRPEAASGEPATEKRVPLLVAVLCGAAIGLLAGLTGTGGGIFLTPLLLFMGWAETRRAAGVSVAFILVNSIAGIVGHLSTIPTLPAAIPYWALAAGAGGLIGSDLGSRRLGSLALRRLLSLVLIIAGVKLLLV